MRLHYALPRIDLRPFVRSYYMFEADEAGAQALSAELGNIRILAAGGGHYLMADGRRTAAPRAALIGPTLAAYRFETTSRTRVFGIGILPRGWGALIGADANELADRIVDLESAFGSAARAAAAGIAEASDLAEMCAVADLFLSQRIAGRSERGGFYPEAIERWLLDAGDPGPDRLLDIMDVSRRQTDRIAKRFFGASPKLLQRKYRALRAADRILRNQAGWRDVAGPSFYDQSHFIKEFRTFIGATPAGYAAEGARLLREIQHLKRAKIIRHWDAIL
jgi:AraC-like DNA-binding protein